ncbi:MAG: V-type ATP synthase subunit E [Mobilitalea sp.]
MTGLEKILKAIDADAQAGADTIIAQAKQEADEILAAAKIEASKKCMQIAEKSDADVKAVISRAESAAALQEKKIILDTKQQIISNIISDARNSLAKLPDSEYTDIILQMVKKYAHNKPGKLLFSAIDKSRLSADFDSKLRQALSDKPTAALTVSEENATLDGGFLLIYGDIEENCSFDALFSAAKENLQDKVNSLLFE